MIVVSILLALAAEAWWQERTDRSEEQVLLSALYDEFVGNGGTLRAQADSISEAILVLESVVGMTATELQAALDSHRREEIAMAVQRPWTVEYRVGAINATLGTDKASLIRSHEIRSELAQYQAVQRELDEIGGLLATVAVQAFVAFGTLPEGHRELTALLKAKTGYWRAYRKYLDRFIAHTEGISALLAEELARTDGSAQP